MENRFLMVYSYRTLYNNEQSTTMYNNKDEPYIYRAECKKQTQKCSHNMHSLVKVQKWVKLNDASRSDYSCRDSGCKRT